jgi:hypothetical protein
MLSFSLVRIVPLSLLGIDLVASPSVSAVSLCRIRKPAESLNLFFLCLPNFQSGPLVEFEHLVQTQVLDLIMSRLKCLFSMKI